MKAKKRYAGILRDEDYKWMRQTPARRRLQRAAAALCTKKTPKRLRLYLPLTKEVP